MAFVGNISPSQNDVYYFSEIGRALDYYTQKHDKLILAGDFNAEEKEMVSIDLLFQQKLYPVDAQTSIKWW